jgi:thymidine kinase
MDLINTTSSLDLVIGPMFSGKTSELVRQLNIFSKANFKVLYINSIVDTRDVMFSTHNESLSKTQGMDMIKTDLLYNCYDKCTHYDVIAIDEAQFFDDLYDFCMLMVEKEHKKLIVAGLSGTSDRQVFGQITKLIPISDNIMFYKSFCVICAKEHKMNYAIFSKRLINDNDIICVGGSDLYIPTCRKHYK